MVTDHLNGLTCLSFRLKKRIKTLGTRQFFFNLETEEPKQISLKNVKVASLDFSGQHSSNVIKLASYYFQKVVKETEGISFPDQTHRTSVVKYYCRCINETLHLVHAVNLRSLERTNK